MNKLINKIRIIAFIIVSPLWLIAMIEVVKSI